MTDKISSEKVLSENIAHSEAMMELSSPTDLEVGFFWTFLACIACALLLFFLLFGF